MVGLPKLTQNKTYQPIPANNETDISNLWKDKSNWIMFNSKLPWLSQETNQYVLTFSEHVKISSVKNFKLVHFAEKKLDEIEEENEDVVFEFGKINKTDYSLLFRHPFSILNAFGIALSWFDK